jgi:transporter, monovalent cation:proton antiporter-2 (CPA2) family
MHSPLDLTLVLLAAAVLGVVAFRMLQLPPMLGYLAVGILIGPHALGLASDSGQTKYLAEFGVVFLMFSIGLEFNLAKLRAMRRLVFGLGGSQVVLTMLAVAPVGWLFSAVFDLSWQASIALGGALAMSSTAIVSKMLSERLELETEHGRNIFSVLLFQDLAVVPLLIVIPALSRDPGELPMALGLAIIKIVVALTLIFVLGKEVVSRWFHVVAARRSQELFMLNLLLVTLGMAALTERLGLSMALGAFMAGMLIAETPYRHQVEEDIKPFRDVLLGLFFVTIGMLLNVRVVIDNLWLVLTLLIVPVLFKFLLIAGLARLFGSRPGVAIRTGLGLAPGRRVRLRAAEPDRRAGPGRSGADAGDSRVDAAVDAGGAVPDPVQRRDRDALCRQRMAAAIAEHDAHRGAEPADREARDHLRLRPQRPEPGAHARARGHRLCRAGPGP